MNTNKITNNKKELIKKFSLSDFTKHRIDKGFCEKINNF